MDLEKRTIMPLFWQHHEPEADLRREIQKMREGGCGAFIMEARPHPDYLSDGWWEDIAICIDEAKRQAMDVWLFDDGAYPSGQANGLIAEKYPQYLKKYLAVNHMDVTGPRPGASFFISQWLAAGEEVFRVIAGRRDGRGNAVDADSLVDVTAFLSGGQLYWDVPKGDWRVFLIKTSPYGEEEHTKDYLNPLEPEAVRVYLDLVHEEHYKRFAGEFGKTIKGFFTDEPRFGNTKGYDRIIGHSIMPLPYRAGLIEELEETLPGFARLLPLLWYDGGEASADVRYAYMDQVSRLFGECFIGQMGDWCRSHGVKLIGHLVEENGAHSRLGYGAGHFFRALRGMDASGLDVVNNLFLEQTGGYFTTCFNFYDCDMNHWGLPKLASSASHLDPKKGGITVCEAFGANGWNEGLKLMKWITDVLAVRGVNRIIPHAFSPAPFPDPDCPPHFYAGGHNPQFRAFPVWGAYANRVCNLLSGGTHVAPAAVLYHAEAEWGGESEPFEKAVKALCSGQIDCDVIDGDTLCDPKAARLEDGLLRVGEECYRVIVVPYAQYLPEAVAARLKKAAEAGVPVYFTHGFPQRCYYGAAFDERMLRTCETASLAEQLLPFADITLDKPNPDLCYYHYVKENINYYFFHNQSAHHRACHTIHFPFTTAASLYDAMENRFYRAQQAGNEITLTLEPFESIFIVFDGVSRAAERPRAEAFQNQLLLEAPFAISTATAEQYPAFVPAQEQELGNLATPGKLTAFSGTVRYEKEFECANEGPAFLDLGEAYEICEVRVNGVPAGTKICPPYAFVIAEGVLRRGTNRIEIDVTNTLAKQETGCAYDRFFPQEPTGLIGPVRLFQ